MSLVFGLLSSVLTSTNLLTSEKSGHVRSLATVQNQTWICTQVIHAACDSCKVSALGRCSHVVAVLFFLLDYVNEHGPTISTPCTSKECTWNKGKKETKILKDYQMCNILQKESLVVVL